MCHPKLLVWQKLMMHGIVIIVTSNPTPIWSDVNGRMLEVTTDDSILPLNISASVTTNSTLVTMGMVKGVVAKLEPLQIGLIILVVASTCSLCCSLASNIWTSGENI